MDKNLFSNDESYYERYRRSGLILDEYKKNIRAYLYTVHGDVPRTTIDTFVDEMVTTNFKDKDAKMFFQTSLGNFESITKGLWSIANKLNNLIVTPYGSVFVKKDVKTSFFSDYIQKRQNDRKPIKQAEIAAQARGDKHEAKLRYMQQLNIKVDINAITGIMLSNTFFGNPVSYNSITSSARFNIMLAYGYTELFLGGNQYLFNENKAINRIVTLINECPDIKSIREVVDLYKLKIPSIDEVYEFYVSNLNTYAKFGRKKNLRTLIERLSETQRIFVFYASNLKNVFWHNPHFKRYLDDIFDYKQRTKMYPDTGATSIFDVGDGALLNVVSTIMTDEIGSTPIVDIDSKRPELAKRMLSYYKFLSERLLKLNRLFEVLVYVPVVPSDIIRHKNMIRKNTILSDTDSIIFTNVKWAEWYTDDIVVNDKALAVNAISTYFISKSLEYVFGYTSACMNIVMEDLKGIAIKNEYMFTVFIRTIMSKHYTGYIKYREGACLTPPKFELKGKAFIGSDLCLESFHNCKSYIKWVLDEILDKYDLSSEKLIAKAILVEQLVIKSVHRGESTYINLKPINRRSDYGDDCMSKSYFYYELWEQVFAEKKGQVHLPQKFQAIPIVPVSFKRHKVLETLKSSDPIVHKKLVTFLEKFPKRTIKTILVPLGTPIPECLVPIINYTQIAYDNCNPLYLFLKSFNIVNSSTKKTKVLFSDEYVDIRDRVIEAIDKNDIKIPFEGDT